MKIGIQKIKRHTDESRYLVMSETTMSVFNDTIFALATPPGVSGVCVMRLSGPHVPEIVMHLTGRKMVGFASAIARAPEGAHIKVVSRETTLNGQTIYTAFYDSQKTLIDKGLLLTFPAPRSFTGEHVAEFQLHGSLAVIEAMSHALLATTLCRLAEPGEFARRALMHGKLDLAQIEGLADLLEAQTAGQLKQSLAHAGGLLAKEMKHLAEKLLHILVLIEATIDFPDEDDVTDAPLQEAKSLIHALQVEIDAMLAASSRGMILREGLVIALAGLPNAGKSSLLNYFAGSDVAIVSAIAGTTRDAMVVSCTIQGVLVRFVDMAGIRETQDEIEQEGIKRAKAWLERASLILHLQAVDESEKLVLNATCPVWQVTTKIDRAREAPEGFAISVKTKQGLAALEDAIAQMVSRETTGEPALLIRERHVQIMKTVKAMLENAARLNISQQSELVAEEIRKSLLAVAAITGYTGVEAMLDKLFSGFCIGK
jgi:tRNA modification GTPase